MTQEDTEEDVRELAESVGVETEVIVEKIRADGGTSAEHDE